MIRSHKYILIIRTLQMHFERDFSSCWKYSFKKGEERVQRMLLVRCCYKRIFCCCYF